jgi:hypothetical protein
VVPIRVLLEVVSGLSLWLPFEGTPARLSLLAMSELYLKDGLMTREDKLSAALDQAMEILTKVVESEEYPAAIRCDAQELLRRWQRGEFLPERKA